MPSLPSWLRHASRALSSRLDRLRLTFDNLHEQVRDAVSHQIGHTVAGAVREAVHYLLEQAPTSREQPAWRSQTATSRNPMWEDEDADPWANREERWRSRDQTPSVDEVDSYPVTEPARANLNRAVLVGCEAAAYWLRQRWGQLPLLAAFLIGSLAAALTYVGGPLAAAGVAVAGSAVSLMTLTKTTQLGDSLTSPLPAP